MGWDPICLPFTSHVPRTKTKRVPRCQETTDLVGGEGLTRGFIWRREGHKKWLQWRNLEARIELTALGMFTLQQAPHQKFKIKKTVSFIRMVRKNFFFCQANIFHEFIEKEVLNLNFRI